MEPRPYEGVGGAWWGWRWTKERVVEDADPYGSLRNRPRAAVLRRAGAAWEMVKTPPVRAAFSTFHLKYTNPEPLFSGYPSVQASAPQSGQVFPAARSSSM